MRKEIYGYLESAVHTIVLSFSNIPVSLQKSEKFQFLRQKLAEYHMNMKNAGAISVLAFASEQ